MISFFEYRYFRSRADTCALPGLKLGVSICISAAASGCGGTGGNEPVVVAPVTNYATFSEIQVDSTILTDAFVDSNGTPILPRSLESELPTTGAATFSGFVVASTEGEGLIGQVSIAASFSGATLDGTAWNFIHESNGEYTGTLAGTGIIRSDATGDVPQISITLEGDLANNGSTFPTMMAFEGYFLGSDLVAIGGNADGFVGDHFATGIFAAEQ
ncbi:hypothetical protein SAMN04488005_1483 [Yoonia tamlensis]|uniref:Transferrin-binding protein B C-lobe/N-lobe beta barrel domain-containing protein n=1 Tax=Yoonia tamlensis TaxID=390270 RepID=A0A1I6GDS0_9RHOB|nr:hypothetical protein [Yoonia tamlensis]SFR40342.1 hypothetical protein SAMN04488005_1483 [Yoonia tamlensis]